VLVRLHVFQHRLPSRIMGIKQLLKTKKPLVSKQQTQRLLEKLIFQGYKTHFLAFHNSMKLRQLNTFFNLQSQRNPTIHTKD
jgi:hypothetical protein